MVYCGKPSKGCAPCRTKRTKVREFAKTLPFWEEENALAQGHVSFPGANITPNNPSVTKLDRFVASVEGRVENAQGIGMSKICFATKPTKS